MGQGASSLRNLENRIGYQFQNPELLKEAITHDSLRAHDMNIKHYQRLEHLGDSVLQLVITEYLFDRYPLATEGQLTSRRADLVNRNNQSRIAEDLELKQVVKMAPSVRDYNGYDNFVESLIGGIYLDAGAGGRGYETARFIIYKLWNLKAQNRSEEGGYGCVVM